MITERQKKILDSIIGEYIGSAQPVSSQLIEKKYDFGISPATIRIEMQKLTDKGFLFQPHTSAGRVPTDRGYRLFVDRLFEKELFEPAGKFEIDNWLDQEFDSAFKLLQSLTKNLALASSSLILSYLEKEKIFWKEGWEEILRQPEFEGKDYLINFAEFLENFEESIEDFEINPVRNRRFLNGVNSGIRIYIGRENPLPKAKDFSIISSKCSLPDDGETIISLLGPKRMDYKKNINLINCLINELKN